MRLERVTNTEHPSYQRALEGYRISFPLHEQREAVSQKKILSDPDYHFNLIYAGNTFVGLLLCWETEHFIYIEHLCILPEARNQHYGKKTLELLKKQGGKTIILEIDPPVDQISIRRKGFYERCGFLENPYPHVHPPYHQDCQGHALVIMSFPDKLTPAEYDRFAHYLKYRVMADAHI